MSYIEPLAFFSNTTTKKSAVDEEEEKTISSKQEKLFYILCNYSWPDREIPITQSRNYFFLHIYFNIPFDYDMLELIGRVDHANQIRTWRRYVEEGGIITGDIPHIFENGRNLMREYIHSKKIKFKSKKNKSKYRKDATSENSALIFFISSGGSGGGGLKFYLPASDCAHIPGTIAYEAKSEISIVKKNEPLPINNALACGY